MSYPSFKKTHFRFTKSLTATEAAIIPKQEISKRNPGSFPNNNESDPFLQIQIHFSFVLNSQVAIVFLLLWLLQLIEQAF